MSKFSGYTIEDFATKIFELELIIIFVLIERKGGL